MSQTKNRLNKKHGREEIVTCASVNGKIDVKVTSEFVVPIKISPQILTRLSDFLIYWVYPIRKIPVPW